jgi:hypothetical protein
MKSWSIIGPEYYIKEFQKSKYFQKTLGTALTTENKNTGGRELVKNDFKTWYYKKFKSLLFLEGKIGPLELYTDYYIKKNVLGFFLKENPDDYQYAIDWDGNYITENGIDSWLGKILKDVNESIEEENIKPKEEKVGDGNKLYTNPGEVSWDDLKDYMNKKKKQL